MSKNVHNELEVTDIYLTRVDTRDLKKRKTVTLKNGESEVRHVINII